MSHLTTDPATLAQLIKTGKTGLTEVGFQPTVDASSWYGPSYTFLTAVEILATPALGSTPALRTALYHVMANVPGVELVGMATDYSGSPGTEIAGPVDPKTGVRFEVIIDPDNGTILDQKAVIADPSEQPAGYRRCVTAGYVSDWTEYTASGVVNSRAATTNSGTTPPTGNTGTTAASGPSASGGSSDST